MKIKIRMLIANLIFSPPLKLSIQQFIKKNNIRLLKRFYLYFEKGIYTMSKKGQKYTLLQNRPSKFQKLTSPNHPKSYFQELQALSNQVEQSKIAVENITTFGANQQSFRTKIDAIQNQLQVCITNINIQTKRNKLLNELVNLLKGEMLKYQNTEKKKEEAEDLQREKIMKKIQYEIDQICQKHNEQIAKIHQLKELANSRRSERVVYSNLFKKLEKQIKFYEESYKDQLIKCVTLESKQIALSKQKQDVKEANFDEEDEVLMNQSESSHIFQSNFHDTFHKNSWNPCKNHNHLTYLQLEKKRTIDREHSDLMRIGREQKSENPVQLEKNISELKNLIEKVKTYAQCESVDEILCHYSRLKEENDEIKGNIEDEEVQIERIYSDINSFSKKIAEIKFQRQFAPIPTEEENSIEQSSFKQSNKQAMSKINSENFRFTSHISEILSVFQIECEASEMKEELVKLSSALNQLSNEQVRERPIVFPRMEKGTKISRQDSNVSQAGLNSILDRMDKFNNCQKIFDRKYFQQEYYKQVSRKKNSNSGSKLKKYF